jgi:hypothetical protein
MYKKRSVLLPIAAILLILPTIVEAIGISIYVSGIEDTQGLTSVMVSNGLATVGATRVDSDHDEEIGTDWVQTGIDEITGEPIFEEQEVVHIVNRWTRYQADAPQFVMGQAATVCLNGSQWSALRLMNDPSDVAEISVDINELGGNPFPNNTDPNTNISDLGNLLRIGKWWDNANRSVFTLRAWDNAFSEWPAVGLDSVASTENAYWRWIHPGSIAMELDYLHRLTLRPNGNGNTILLDPSLGQIVIGGVSVVTATNAPTLLGAQFIRRTPDGVNLGLQTQLRAQSGSLPPQLVLGKYNDNRLNDVGVNHTQGVLIVGNGTGPSVAQRTNGLRILDDGTILTQPRGDLLMGGFDGGPRP